MSNNFGVAFDGPSGAKALDSGDTIRIGSPNATVDSSGNLTAASVSAPVSAATQTVAGSHGETEVLGSSTELITLSTSGATTDSTTNLLPANALIDAVVARITTTITTATDWSLGDATTAARFAAASTGLTAGSTVVGLVAANGAAAAGPQQAAAAKLRITCTGTPGAGAVRVTVFWRKFAAPTS